MDPGHRLVRSRSGGPPRPAGRPDRQQRGRGSPPRADQRAEPDGGRCGAARCDDGTGGLMGLTLVVGGIRSGKSEYAERLAEAAGLPVVYVATGAGSRRFLDLSGEAMQLLASSANAVWLVVAGQAMPLKAANAPTPEAGGNTGTELRVHGDSQVPPGALDFAVNVVPGGPSPQIRERLSCPLSTIDRYPDA